MMEHIRQFDWCTTDNDQSFINIVDANKCVTEKIIRNRFIDPTLAYVNKKQERNKVPKVNWDEVFSDNSHFGGKNFKTFIPALRPIPPYPKLSSINSKEHNRCLRVLCSQNPHVLSAYHMPRPVKMDYRIFEEIKEKYEAEKKEYIEWAKTLWLNGSCIRSLRPKPAIEVAYEADFKIRFHAVQSFPKEYTMAAQIPLRKDGNFEFKCKQELIHVNISELPQIYYPKVISSQFTVLRPCSMPEPCNKHPCRFILPNEKSVSILPMTEVHRELAQYAVEQGASAIAGEGALKCLLETDRSWVLPLSVCQALNPDGEEVNIAVMGSEFSIKKESAPRRTYRALKHMLHSAFILPEEKAKMIDKSRTSSIGDKNDVNRVVHNEEDSDDEDNRLLIDIKELEAEKREETNKKDDESETNNKHKSGSERDDDIRSPVRKRPRLLSDEANDIGIFSCMCQDSLFETPPPRSFKLWEVKDKKNKDLDPFKLIIHCSHKTRRDTREVILEPIPEFLIEVAGTEHSPEQQMSLALSLMLRKNAILINARIDGNVGDLATVEEKTLSDIVTDNIVETISGTLYSVLDQITGLMPGQYVLLHEANHGTNVLLYSSGGSELSLFSTAPLDEATQLLQPPRFAPVLLPYHKYRGILPCAFTPYENQLAKDTKKPVTKQKLPPPALRLQLQGATGKQSQYPRRKKKKGKRN